MIETLTPIIGAYLLGSVPFALIVARIYGVPDLRAVGSGNIGATNVHRAAGFAASLWVYLLDIGKGAAAVIIAQRINQDLLPRDVFLVLVALASIIGHIFPLFIGFRGGKGVNTALGAVGSLFPIEALICLGVFLAVVLPTRYISLGSICGAAAFALVILIERFALRYDVSDAFVITAVVIGLLVPITHARNIRRLIAGTENKVSLRSSKERSRSSAEGHRG